MPLVARICAIGLAVLALLTASVVAQPAGDEVLMHAAGSLRGALTEVALAWQVARPGARVRLTFGASGLLKDRLLKGEASHVFASANMEHPQALADAGLAAAPERFARNRLCALVAPALMVTSQTLVARLLDPQVRVGTSTPKADPAGDYAWMMFERIESTGSPGAFKTLSAKALQLTGGQNSPPPPAGRNVYGALMEAGYADVFITYCTNAVTAIAEAPQLQRVDVPDAVNVSASYGVTVLNGGNAVSAVGARDFVDFLLAPAGQAVLTRHGFAPL